MKVKALVTQSCLTLCDPMDYNLPGSSVHGISQGRILEWVAISCSRGFSQLRIKATSLESLALGDKFLPTSATWEVPLKGWA